MKASSITFALFGLATALLFAVSARAEISCDIGQIKDRQFDAVVGGKKLSFIGWSHGDWWQADFVGGFWTQIAHSSDCGFIEDSLRKMFANDSIRTQLGEAKRVGDLLLEKSKAGKFTLGVERDPEDSDNVMKSWDTVHQYFSVIQRHCPNVDLEPLSLVLLGPEASFGRNNPGITNVEGLEDKDIKAKSIEKLNSPDMQIDPKKLGFSPAALAMIDHGLASQPSDEEERRLVDSEPNPVLKQKLIGLYAMRRIAVQGVSSRDEAILKKVFSTNRNYVVVIGSAHLEDLRAKIGEYCQTNSETLNTSSSTGKRDSLMSR